MPYITREDGEHFVIPSYRDVLSSKRKNQLKADILTLSQSYGEYITLQRKNANQYEVAFSPDTGYLLGESIWQQFKRPADMIYCEAIPNTMEALLVIVKNGGVYLDGSFPLDSIPEELVIFLTQQNNFEIYIHGDVPISEMPQEGKFSFEASSIKSFSVLDAPVFPTLPLLKSYQLQLVDVVLKANGIGVFPTKQLVGIAAVAGVLWAAYSYFTTPPPVVQQQVAQVNPYQQYYDALATPAPNEEINNFIDGIRRLLSMPGWLPTEVNYTKGVLIANVITPGGKIQSLIDWANANRGEVDIKSDGIYVSLLISNRNRPQAKNIYSLKQVIANFTDKLASVYPGNHLSLSTSTKKGPATDMVMTVKFNDISLGLLATIAEQFQDLPMTIESINIKFINASISGSIIVQALGN